MILVCVFYPSVYLSKERYNVAIFFNLIILIVKFLGIKTTIKRLKRPKLKKNQSPASAIET